MSDELENIEEEDEFMVTGRIVIEAGMNSQGELQWRWKREDIEPALALGFLIVMIDEIKADISQSGEDDWEE